MKQESIEKIKQFKKQMYLQQYEKDQLWDIYLEYKGRYPNGEKSCSRCLSDALNEVWNYINNLPVVTVEEQFKDSTFKPGSHEKPEIIKKKRTLTIDQPDVYVGKILKKKK